MLPVSVLPRRDDVPPSEAKEAADRPGVVQREDGWGRHRNSRFIKNFNKNSEEHPKHLRHFQNTEKNR